MLFIDSEADTLRGRRYEGLLRGLKFRVETFRSAVSKDFELKRPYRAVGSNLQVIIIENFQFERHCPGQFVLGAK